MRKLLLLSLIIFLPFIAKAYVSQGSCGDNATYTLDTETGLLILEGSENGGKVKTSPWNASLVKTIQIKSSIRELSSNNGDLFDDCINCTNIIIDDSEDALDLSFASYSVFKGYQEVGSLMHVLYTDSYSHLFPSSLTSLYLGRNIEYSNFYPYAHCVCRAFQSKPNLSSISVGPNVTDIDFDEFKDTEWFDNACTSGVGLGCYLTY